MPVATKSGCFWVVDKGYQDRLDGWRPKSKIGRPFAEERGLAEPCRRGDGRELAAEASAEGPDDP